METTDAANSKQVFHTNSFNKSHLEGSHRNNSESRDSQFNHTMTGIFKVKYLRKFLAVMLLQFGCEMLGSNYLERLFKLIRIVFCVLLLICGA